MAPPTGTPKPTGLFLATAIALLVSVTAACSTESADTPVELAEQHIAAINDGDLDAVLEALGSDTPIMEMGTKDDPRTVAVLAFEIGAIGGASGFVAECEPWGESGARCEGPFHEELFEPAGLPLRKTLVYQFDDGGKITRLGGQTIHDLDDYLYERELADWLARNYPELALDLVEYGLIKHSGAVEIERLIPLVDEFIAASPNWPKQPRRG